jgi:hypothetical protein
MHKTIVFALLLAATTTAGCSLYADDAPEIDAGSGPLCIVPPTSREAEAIVLCTPELGLCPGADVYECRREAESFIEDGSSYCPGSL